MTDTTQDMRERVVALETRFDSTLPHLATKADIQGLKVWVLSGFLGSVIAAIAAVAALLIAVTRFV